MENNKSITDLICPITGSPLWYVGTEKHCMDPDSWYSPESDSSIIFARHPFSMNLFRLVETKGTMEKALRYFRLNTDRSWTEMKEAPYTNSLFPLDDFSEEWEAACKEGLERLEKRKQQEQYWKEHPEEDPRVFAKTVALEKVDVVPLGPPTGILFYLDYKYNPDI